MQAERIEMEMNKHSVPSMRVIIDEVGVGG